MKFLATLKTENDDEITFRLSADDFDSAKRKALDLIEQIKTDDDFPDEVRELLKCKINDVVFVDR